MIHKREIGQDVWEPDEQGVLRKNRKKITSYWAENIGDCVVLNEQLKEGTNEHYQEFKKMCTPMFSEDDVKLLYAKIFCRQTSRYPNDTPTYPLGRTDSIKRLVQ